MPIKLTLIAAALVIGSIALTIVASAPASASAQTNVCQVNPGPVDPGDPDIVVESPSAGDTVASPLTVTGQARTFEATVQVALFGADGEEIAATFGTAAAPDAGVHGPFSITLDFAATGSTEACLWVFEQSAKTGNPVNVVQIPLTLESAALPLTGVAALDAGNYWSIVLLMVLGTVGVVLGAAGLLVRRRIA